MPSLRNIYTHIYNIHIYIYIPNTHPIAGEARDRRWPARLDLHVHSGGHLPSGRGLRNLLERGGMGWPGVISGVMMVMGENDMADLESNVEHIFKVEESGNHSHEESGKNMEKYLQHWRNRRIF